jgi:hypothetical protein
MQVGAAAMEPPAGGDPEILKDAMASVFRAIPVGPIAGRSVKAASGLQ